MVGKWLSFYVPTSLKMKFITKNNILHYSWIIVFVAVVVQGVGSAIRMSFGVMIDPLADSFGWTPGEVGLSYGLMSIISALFSPIAGWLGTKYGARETMFIGSFLFLVGMILTGYTQTLLGFYFSYGLLFGISQSMLLVPIIPAVATWFRRHLGIATGIIMVSWSLGPALMIQLLAVLLKNNGWNNTFIIIGIYGFVILIILLLIFKNTPEQSGRIPFGTLLGDKPLISSGERFNQLQKSYESYAYKTNSFWNLVNLHFLGCVGHAIILIAIIPLAISRGINPITAAGILSTISLVSVITRFLGPILSDYFGSKIIFFISFIGQGLGVLLLINATSVMDFYIFAIIWAIPYGGEGGPFPVVNRQYYGHMPMGTIYGWQILGAGIGMAIGGMIPGVIFDLYGNYNIAIYLSAIFSIAGGVLVYFLNDTKKSLIPDWPEVET